jgi:hypothetical protein
VASRKKMKGWLEKWIDGDEGNLDTVTEILLSAQNGTSL